ncbi:MAG: CPBP family intramembrane glutamic endopeptidase [Saonia sp.]
MLLPNFLRTVFNLNKSLTWIPFLSITFFFSFLTVAGLFYKSSKTTGALLIKELRIKKIKLFDIAIIISSTIAILVLTIVFQSLPIGVLFSKFSFISPEPIFGKVNKTVIIMTIIFFPLATIAEEIFWRGYLLPLQEKHFGKMGWIINGFLWAMSHILTHNPLRLLITSFGIAFVGTKFKNTSVTILIHLLINSITLNKLVTSYLSQI